eukprot:3514095-Pleurochrysis_carterae.AAC.1
MVCVCANISDLVARGVGRARNGGCLGNERRGPAVGEGGKDWLRAVCVLGSVYVTGERGQWGGVGTGRVQGDRRAGERGSACGVARREWVIRRVRWVLRHGSASMMEWRARLGSWYRTWRRCAV